jgi:hypothetical protein
MKSREEIAAYQKAYRERNKERLAESKRERGKRDYQAHKARYAAKSKLWREQNPERYREATKRYQLRNREKVILTSREWYANNKDRASATNRTKKLRNYGLTQELFDAMLKEQAGLCWICQKLMSQPSVDHDHQTGAVRGLLCRTCNAALGQFRDNQGLLQRAIEYLNSSSGATLTQSNAA